MYRVVHNLSVEILLQTDTTAFPYDTRALLIRQFRCGYAMFIGLLT